MSEIFNGRWTSQVEGGLVVFLIGMRINKPLAFSKWRPVAQAMPKMQQELGRHPELGCIRTENWFGRTTISVQYWRDYESLYAYARNPSESHLPAWRAFNKAIRDNGTVGIWHETFRVEPGGTESIYGNMPRIGLGAAFDHVQVVAGQHSAAKRMQVADSDDTAVEPY